MEKGLTTQVVELNGGQADVVTGSGQISENQAAENTLALTKSQKKGKIRKRGKKEDNWKDILVHHHKTLEAKVTSMISNKSILLEYSWCSKCGF